MQDNANQNPRGMLFFLALCFLLMMAWPYVWQRFFPADKQAPAETVTPAGPDGRKPEAEASPTVRLPVVVPTPDPRLVTVGSTSRDSAFELGVTFDPRGAAVRSVTLNKFQAADEAGRPVWQPADGDGPAPARRVPAPLELVPDDAVHPSHVLLHYEPEDRTGERPLDTLARTTWQVVPRDGRPVKEDRVDLAGDVVSDGTGRLRQSVAFRTAIDGVQITKTYSVVEGEYHIGLDVEMAVAPGTPGPKVEGKGDGKKAAPQFRYQLTGAHGLPVEGKWYTTTYRNALIALQDPDRGVTRDFQDLRQIAGWGGGNEVLRKAGNPIRYAGVAVQYFASVIVVDPNQPTGKDDFLDRARPTMQRAVAKGTVRSVNWADAKDREPGQPIGSFRLSSDGGASTLTFFVRPADEAFLTAMRVGQPAAVIYETAPFDPKLRAGADRDDATQKNPKVALDVLFGDRAAATHALWEDDITVRVVTDRITLSEDPGKPVKHRYLLYNGPVKVSQLRYLEGERAVSGKVIDQYLGPLALNTLTDYQMPGWFGDFLAFIRWTWLVIQCTNLMHWVLGKLHFVVPSLGLCIMLLTVLVRGLMFPFSRKQALMGIKMQELAPEMKALGEKYKDDPQGKQVAQMELFRKHGVNPLGSCWFMLLQMPIMMGLYYALQESILFRLGSFWPTWITNLAAPDMMVYWTDKIPFISRPEDFTASIVYMGPYLNILPLIAVVLMIIQQKMYTPPPTDEQQEAQQKMMKYMMAVMGFMFYKVASGLCIYFIASSLWGFAERRLLPKAKKLGVGGVAVPTGPTPPVGSSAIAQMPAGGSGSGGGSSAVTTGHGNSGARKNKPGRRRKGGAPRPAEPEPATPGLGGWLRRRRDALGTWWEDLLEQAKKKG